MSEHRTPRDTIPSEDGSTNSGNANIPNPEGQEDPTFNQMHHALHDMHLAEGNTAMAAGIPNPEATAPVDGAVGGAPAQPMPGLFSGFRRPVLQRQHGVVEGQQDVVGLDNRSRKDGDKDEQIPYPFRDAYRGRGSKPPTVQPPRSQSVRPKVRASDNTSRSASVPRNQSSEISYNQHYEQMLNPTEEALSKYTDIQEIIDVDMNCVTVDDLQAMLVAVNNADPEEHAFYPAFIKAMRDTILGKLNELEPDNQWLQSVTNQQQPLLSPILENKTFEQQHEATQNVSNLNVSDYVDSEEFWTLDEIQYQAKVTDDKINSHAEHNKRLKELKAQLHDYITQLSFREQMLQEPTLTGKLKSLARSDISVYKKKIEGLSKKIRNMTHIIDDRSTDLTLPNDGPDSDYDLHKIRKLVASFTNTERILRIIVQEAKAHKLSHSQIKELLRLTLPEAAYDTFHANIDYPLKVIFKLLSDQFIDHTTPFAKINDLTTFKFKPKETIRSGLVRLDTLISTTNSLFPPNERVGRRANLKQDVLLGCIPDDVRGKLELNKVKALRQGRFYSLDEMLDDCEDHLTSLRLPLIPTKTVVHLQSLQVNNAPAPSKKRRFNGKPKPQANSTQSGQSLKKNRQNEFQSVTNALGRKVLVRKQQKQKANQKPNRAPNPIPTPPLPPPTVPPPSQRSGGYPPRGRGGYRGYRNKGYRPPPQQPYQGQKHGYQSYAHAASQPPYNPSYRGRGSYRGRKVALQRQISYVWNENTNTHQIVNTPIRTNQSQPPNTTFELTPTAASQLKETVQLN